MPGYRDLLAKVKQKIREVDPAEAESRLGDATFVDVRELDEWEQGTLPAAVHIPRGYLESQIEQRVPDRDVPVVVYCASDTCQNSHVAAKALRDLGYQDVRVYVGGKADWTAAGLPLEQ
jgi:rhodanese-related sulfurtransferase